MPYHSEAVEYLQSGETLCGILFKSKIKINNKMEAIKYITIKMSYWHGKLALKVKFTVDISVTILESHNNTHFSTGICRPSHIHTHI